MKYNWENMTDDDKWAAVSEELRLITHMGTTKDDLIEIIKFLDQQNRVADKAFEITLSCWVTGINVCILDLEGHEIKPNHCPDFPAKPTNEDCCKCWKEIVMTKAVKELEI